MPRRPASSAKRRQAGPSSGSAVRTFSTGGPRKFGVLRRGDELGAVGGGALDEAAGREPVGLGIGGRGHLDDGGEEHRTSRERRGDRIGDGARDGRDGTEPDACTPAPFYTHAARQKGPCSSRSSRVRTHGGLIDFGLPVRASMTAGPSGNKPRPRRLESLGSSRAVGATAGPGIVGADRTTRVAGDRSLRGRRAAAADEMQLSLVNNVASAIDRRGGWGRGLDPIGLRDGRGWMPQPGPLGARMWELDQVDEDLLRDRWTVPSDGSGDGTRRPLTTVVRHPTIVRRRRRSPAAMPRNGGSPHGTPEAQLRIWRCSGCPWLPRS